MPVNCNIGWTQYSTGHSAEQQWHAQKAPSAAAAMLQLWIAASRPEGKALMPASQLALLGGHISGVVGMRAVYFPAGCDAVPRFALQIMQTVTGEVLKCDSHIRRVSSDRMWEIGS